MCVSVYMSMREHHVQEGREALAMRIVGAQRRVRPGSQVPAGLGHRGRGLTGGGGCWTRTHLREPSMWTVFCCETLKSP